mmetsp:Transcript_19047/g.34456  ORF Transcript_19047/g.34456 Transcript_19047/m.34456 type:complete len:219 (+) Transcript_19047:245-901(+)
MLQSSFVPSKPENLANFNISPLRRRPACFLSRAAKICPPTCARHLCACSSLVAPTLAASADAESLDSLSDSPSELDGSVPYPSFNTGASAAPLSSAAEPFGMAAVTLVTGGAASATAGSERFSTAGASLAESSACGSCESALFCSAAAGLPSEFSSDSSDELLPESSLALPSSDAAEPACISSIDLKKPLLSPSSTVSMSTMSQSGVSSGLSATTDAA